MSLNVELINIKSNCLLPRSGHKLVADGKYLYVLGGYVDQHTVSNTFEVRGEIWRYHLVFKKWEKCSFDQELFKLGASHSAISIGDCVFITGGTGHPFGLNILNSLIVINLKKMTQQMFQFIPKDNMSKNLPIATYGHTMTYVYMNKTPYLFIIGGTTGETYHQEMYQINLITLESQLVSDCETKDVPKPRYKHEAFFYCDNIYVIGGATGTEFCYSFNTIHKFNVRTRIWTVCEATVPIMVPLRCPAMSQNGRYIYVTGGYPNYDFISDGVFQLDLEDLSWSLIGNWTTPSYFHDSVFVPQLGSVFLFGGVHRLVPSQKRNNNLYEFRPPTGRMARSLTDLTWEVVLRVHAAAMEAHKTSAAGDRALAEYLIGLGVPERLVARATVLEPCDVHAA